MGLALALTLILTPTASFSEETTTCLTVDQTIETFYQIAQETGDNLEIVYNETFDDGSTVLMYWKGGDTVLAIAFNPDGCFAVANELTLVEFRELTGIVLAST